MFPGSATESRKIKSMLGTAFIREKHFNPSRKMEKLNGSEYCCTDFYGWPSGYPCPSQTYVMHQSQLCYIHDFLSMVLRCSCILCFHINQDPHMNGSAEHLCFSELLLLRDQQTAEWIQKLLEVLKNMVGWVLQITSVVWCCCAWVTP